MRSKKKVGPLVLGAAATVLSTNTCRKSAETERKEPERTEVRAANKANELNEKAIDEKNDYLAAVRREQLELRGRVQEEIDAIDEKLGDLKVDRDKDGGYAVDAGSKDAKRIQELIQHRQQLETDLDVLQRSDERGWDEVKATIERDLDRYRPHGKT